MATDTTPTSTPTPSTIGQKARRKLASIETEAKTAALSAVNAEKSWFASNWKAIAVGVAIGILAALIVHNL